MNWTTEFVLFYTIASLALLVVALLAGIYFSRKHGKQRGRVIQVRDTRTLLAGDRVRVTLREHGGAEIRVTDRVQSVFDGHFSLAGRSGHAFTDIPHAFADGSSVTIERLSD